MVEVTALEEAAQTASNELFTVLALLEGAKRGQEVGDVQYRLIGVAEEKVKAIIAAFDPHI